jgi:hypothetical protein
VGTQVLKPLPNYQPPVYKRGGTAGAVSVGLLCSEPAPVKGGGRGAAVG